MVHSSRRPVKKKDDSVPTGTPLARLQRVVSRALDRDRQFESVDALRSSPNPNRAPNVVATPPEDYADARAKRDNLQQAALLALTIMEDALP